MYLISGVLYSDEFKTVASEKPILIYFVLDNKHLQRLFTTTNHSITKT